jgi:hypothetical protein
MKKLLVLALLLLSANAFAANSLGIYFESAGTTNTKAYGFEATVTCYVVAKDFTQVGVGAYEFNLMTTPNASPDDYAFLFNQPTWCVNALTAPDFMVGVAPAFPTTGPLWLLRFRFVMPVEPSPEAPPEVVMIGIGPSQEVTSFPGLNVAGYANGACTILTPWIPSSNQFPVPGREGFYYVATVNAPAPVSDTSDSWSGVKSLYR